MTYHQTLPGNPNLELEIVDTSNPATTLGVPTHISADGIILVYSIADRSSFEFAKEVLSTLSTNGLLPPLVLVANKSDLSHLRTVVKGEGHNLANEFGIQFYELSVAESSPDVSQSFNFIVTALTKPPKRRFSVSKILRRLGKMSLAQKQNSDSSSESSFDGNSLPCRASPKLYSFANSHKKTTIDCS